MDTTSKPKFLPLLLYCIAILAVVGSLLLLFSSSDTEYNSIIKSADAKYEEMQYSAALDEYLEAIKLEPTRSEGYYGVNFVLLDKGRLDEAEKVVAQAQELLAGTDSANLNMQIADEMQARGEYGQAVEFYRVAYSYDRKADGLVDKYFSSLLYIGDFEEAQDVSSRVDRDSNHYKAYGLMQTSDDLYKSVQAANAALSYAQPSVVISLLDGFGDSPDVEYWEVNYYLALAHDMLGDKEAALAQYEAAQSLQQGDGSFNHAYARSLLDNGQASRAIEVYEKSLSQDDTNTSLCLELLDAVRQQKANSKSSSISRKCKKATSGVSELYVAHYFNKGKDFEKILDSIDLVKLSPELKFAVRDLLVSSLVANKEVLYEDELAIVIASKERLLYSAYMDGLRAYWGGDSFQAEKYFLEVQDLDLQGDLSRRASEFLTLIEKS